MHDSKATKLELVVPDFKTSFFTVRIIEWNEVASKKVSLIIMVFVLLQCGKMKNLLSPKTFRQIKSSVTSWVNMLLSRNFCEKKCVSKFLVFPHCVLVPFCATSPVLIVIPPLSCQFSATRMWYTCACLKIAPLLLLVQLVQFLIGIANWRTIRRIVDHDWSKRNQPKKLTLNKISIKVQKRT